MRPRTHLRWCSAEAMTARLWSLSALEHAAFVGAGLLVYVMATRIARQRRHPSAAIGWVLGIAAFPYLVVPLFLIFGTRKFARTASPVLPPIRPDPSLRAPPWAVSLLAAMRIDNPEACESVEFHASGVHSLQALVALCRSAKHDLVVQTFIFADDAVGRAIGQELGDAVRRGVKSRLLIDAVGSLKTPSRLLARLRRAGVEVALFMPLWHNPLRGRTNLRNHRKLAIADGETLWSGDQNLAVEYFIGMGAVPAWTGLSFSTRGPIARSARRQYERDWQLAGGAARQGPEAAPAASLAGPPVQWIPSGPDQGDDTVHALLVTAAHHAIARILAVTPYFVPDDVLLQAWTMACLRGVDVTVVVPRHSNHRLADIARESSLRRLVEVGARVMLVPHMVHAKVVLIDDSLGLCGSVNLDGRSLFLNYEVMTAFYGTDQIRWLAQWCSDLAGVAVAHPGGQPGLGRDLLEGLVRAVAFQI